MKVYGDGDKMEAIPPSLGPGEVEHIIVFHDESSFHTNDYQSEYWLKPGEQVLKKKDKGRLIMVSDFIIEETGHIVLTEELRRAQLSLPESERLPDHARIVICPTSKATGDSYWNMEQMTAQLKTVLQMLKALYPNKKYVFIFDNSSAHNSLARDALTVTKMNVNPSGKQAHMHDTVIPETNPHGFGGQSQSMQFPKELPQDHKYFKYAGQPKGIRVILEERGLVRPSAKIVGVCKDCKVSRSRKPQIEGLSPAEEALIEDEHVGDDTEEEEETRPKDCCMQRILSLQDDFRNEKSLLQKVIEEAGHVCLFLPKFHPELNPIEMYWGWAKRYFRERSNGDFHTALKLVHEALNACPLITIRKFFQRVYRYMSAYGEGATGLLAEYAVKQYKSHRAITKTDLIQAEEKMKEQEAKELTKGKDLAR
ncbi:hypothetical protein FRC01_006638 [Tulasnella sp. 417]|nr:hypothetical protein FRC01_006638 [Tulasnella sp. 417]